MAGRPARTGAPIGFGGAHWPSRRSDTCNAWIITVARKPRAAARRTRPVILHLRWDKLRTGFFNQNPTCIPHQSGNRSRPGTEHSRVGGVVIPDDQCPVRPFVKLKPARDRRMVRITPRLLPGLNEKAAG